MDIDQGVAMKTGTNWVRRTFAILLVIFLSGLVAGCATQALRTAATDELATGGAPGTRAYWWFARYSIIWPEGAEPDWRVDLLLADAVIKPVLNAHRQQIGRAHV